MTIFCCDPGLPTILLCVPVPVAFVPFGWTISELFLMMTSLVGTVAWEGLVRKTDCDCDCFMDSFTPALFYSSIEWGLAFSEAAACDFIFCVMM